MTRPYGTLLTGLILSGLAGCAHSPSTLPPPPQPITSGYGSCNQCDKQPFLPRGRLNPMPKPPGDTAWKQSPEPPRAPNVRLYPPEVGEQQRPREDGVLPIDIPQFALARKNVASGQTPLVEGLTWLQDKGYRTVLHVRRPGEDDAAAKRQFTAKGFRYLSIEVSPGTLDRDIVENFNRVVTDADNHPLFVYDRDSSLVGGLWYLYYRTHENSDSDRAAIEAGRLGLNVDADGGSHKDMWLAIQTYLKINKKTSRPVRAHVAGWHKPSGELR